MDQFIFKINAISMPHIALFLICSIEYCLRKRLLRNIIDLNRQICDLVFVIIQYACEMIINDMMH